MKKLVFEGIFIVLGLIAVIERIAIKTDVNIVHYMSRVNQIAGFVTLVMIFYQAGHNINKKISENNQNSKKIKSFFMASFFVVIIYWLVVYFTYQKCGPVLMNDIVTVITLAVALTDDLWIGALQALFYKG